MVSAAALVLVEVGYVAWLERLPAFPSPADPAGFLDLPLWSERPELSDLAADCPWRDDRVGGFGGSQFICQKSHGTVAATYRAIVNKRLKAAALCAVVAGADLLLRK